MTLADRLAVAAAILAAFVAGTSFLCVVFALRARRDGGTR